MVAAHRRHDMTDASYIKAHPHSAGPRRGNQGIARTKGG